MPRHYLKTNKLEQCQKRTSLTYCKIPHVYNAENLHIFLPGGFPGASAGKESPCNAGNLGLISGLGRSPGEGKGYPLQYSGLENSMDHIVHGVTKSWTPLSDFHFHFSSLRLGTRQEYLLLPLHATLGGPSQDNKTRKKRDKGQSEMIFICR